MAYEMAVGVPNPESIVGYDGFNVTVPADPGSWPSAQETGWYYVDKAHVSATDTANTYGYPNKPRLTVPTSITIDGGKKVVVVGDGNSYAGGDITLTQSGASASAGNQAWLEGRSAIDIDAKANWPIFSQRAMFVNGQYMIVENLKFENQADSPVMDLDGTHCTGRHIWGVGSGTLEGGGSIFQSNSYNVMWDYEIADMGEWETNDNADLHGIKVSGSKHDFWISDVIGYRLQGDTVQIGSAGGDPNTLYNVYLSNVSGYDNKENVIDLKDCNTVIISGGTGYGMSKAYGDDEGADMTIHDEANNVWVIGRETYLSTLGAACAGTASEIYFLNCIFRDFTGSDKIYSSLGSGIKIRRPGVSVANCTFYNCTQGVNLLATSTGTGHSIVANIFAGRPSDSYNYDIGIENGSVSSSATVDWNLFEDGQFRRQSTDYATLAAWQSGTSHDTNSAEGAPDFLDAANDDYGIGASSAAIDFGMSSFPAVYATFASEFGRDAKFDFNGVAFPASAGDLDLGAVQYVNTTPAAPTISVHPANVTVDEPNAVNLSVTASGSPALSYQWKKDTVNISGATSSTYSIDPSEAADSGSYTVYISNTEGNVTSNASTVTVSAVANAAPVFTTHPIGDTITEPAPASFTVEVTGNPAPTYQWKKDTVDITGETSATYSIPITTTADDATYTCVATNSEGSATSNDAVLVVNAASLPPTITTQPVDTTVTAPDAMVLTIAATGDAPITYQWWQYSTKLTGETSTTLTVTPTNVGMGNQRYDCVVTNPNGATVSDEIYLTVNAASGSPPDAPSNLIASALPPSVELSWTDNSDDETGFVLEVAEAPFSSYSVVTTTAANDTSYSHTTAAVDTQLAYRIKATNGNGDSAYSNVRYFNTKTNQSRNTPESRTRITTRRR